MHTPALAPFPPADAGGGDIRHLGVAVRALEVDGVARSLAALGDGWNEPEPGLRWTGGDGALPAGAASSSSGSRVAHATWVAPEENDQAQALVSTR